MNDHKPRAPKSLSRFCREVIPLLCRRASGRKMVELVRQIVSTDRWNSFDGFRKTSRTLARAFRAAGARAEVEGIPTGGPVGRGGWIMQDAWDIVRARADIVSPVRRKLLDYRDNPFHVAQHSGSTPPGGARYELVIIDSEEELARLGKRALAGKMVLTRLLPYPYPYRGGAASTGPLPWFEKGAAGIITDAPVGDSPAAVIWAKFGWGSLRVGEAAARPVGLAVSQRQGESLRRLLAKHGRVTIRADVQVRYYNGEQKITSGLVTGRDDPQSEVWAIAHSSEPGAVDNASGLAVCVEAARLLEGLIAEGKLSRPRRTVRLVSAYECYGFFGYLERRRRYQKPLAGVCIDSIGLRPEACGGKVFWHATVPSSAGFVNDVGEAALRAALRAGRPGYRFQAGRFMSTEDTLIGDPRYGFPCPWIWTGKYPGYHSSGDTVKLLHPPGLASGAAAMAGYLYYLANAATPEALELAEWQTDKALAELGALGRRPKRGRVEFIRARHAENLSRLKRWLWGGQHSEALKRFAECERRLAGAAGRVRARPRQAARGSARRVPRRTAFLVPSPENVRPDLAGRLRAAGLPGWALYWADGRRSIAEIAELARAERGREYSLDQVARFFEVLAELGYVELVEPREMITRKRLVRDLERLGVRRGMDVMVHSAMSPIGHVAGGAETVVEALLEAVGKRGTLMFPSFNHGEAEVYNPLATPTKNGAIPDAAWRRPDAVRSVHPSHPAAAIGPKAAEWCRDHVEKGIWDRESPIGRLIHGGGYILSLGVDHGASTAYHVAEISMGGPCLDQFGGVGRVVGADGEVRRVPAMAWRDGRCPAPGGIDAVLDRRKLQRHGKVGNASATLVRAIEVWKVRRANLKKFCPTCKVRPRRKRRRR